MKRRAVRTEVKHEVRRQRGLHIQVEHREPRLRVHVEPPCKEVADEIFKKSPGCFLVAVLREVDEAKETRRDRVNDSRDPFGLHRGGAFGGGGLAERFPFFWLRHEELLVDGPRKFLSQAE